LFYPKLLHTISSNIPNVSAAINNAPPTARLLYIIKHPAAIRNTDLAKLT